MDIVIGLFWFSLFAFLAICCPLAIRIYALVFLSPFQLFSGPFYDVYVPLALILALSMIPRVSDLQRAWDWAPSRAYIMLMLIGALALFWSPDAVSGMRYIFYGIPFLLILMAMMRVSTEGSFHSQRAIGIFLLVAITEAVFVVIFRASPLLEESYLKSEIAGAFVSPNTLSALYDELPNNVLHPDKAGGFFVNGNVAGAFLGIALSLSIGVALAKRSLLHWIGAVIFFVGILFTGSKAAIVLSFAVAFVFFGVSLKRKHLTGSLQLIGIILAVVFVLTIYLLNWQWILGMDPSLAWTFALGSRAMIWYHASEQFLSAPLFGLGFGGWALSYGESVAANLLGEQVFPPHNSLIQAWSDMGILGLVVGGLLMWTIIHACLRGVRVSAKERYITIGIMSAYLWTFVQGFGENYGFLGDFRMQPILAVALGIVWRLIIKGGPSSDDTRSHRNIQESTVSAV